jgi:hypothetical protein
VIRETYPSASWSGFDALNQGGNVAVKKAAKKAAPKRRKKAAAKKAAPKRRKKAAAKKAAPKRRKKAAKKA